MNIPINSVPKNIQWLDLILKDFQDRSIELNDYGFGNTDQINSSELNYPHMWCNPTRTRIISNDGGKNGFSAMETEIELTISDILRSDKENNVETISDVNEMLMTVVAEISQHPYYVQNKVKLVGDIDIENEWEKTDDIVNRCMATITFRWPFSYTWCLSPVEGGTTPVPFTCDPVTVTNSDGSYNVTVLSGGSLILPDSTAQSSLGTFSVTFPSVSTYTIPDVNWTDSTGTTQSTEYSEPIVCTPQITELIIAVEVTTGDDTSNFDIVANSAGTLNVINPSGLTITDFQVNSVTTNLPTTVVAGDNIIIIYNTALTDDIITITGTY